jgi:hypothetical protein
VILSTVYLAAEDAPGLAIGRRLIANASPLTVSREENGRGYATLRAKAPNFQRMASFGYPVLMLTDLDRIHCAPELRRRWLSEEPHANFLFRIAVREVEAWLLADRQGVAAFLKIDASHIPKNPDDLVDAKNELLKLATRSPRILRNGLVPRVGSRAPIGPDYNELLTDFIATKWSLDEATNASPSLKRARAATALLASRL